jgi:hypothetical protein
MTKEMPMQTVWAVLAALWLGYAFFLAPHTYYSGDELVYHLMMKSFAEHGSLLVENGYRETHSSLFRYIFFLRLNGQDELTAQYPPLFAIVMAPFYLLLGIHGIFYANVLLHMVNIWLTFKLSRRLLDDAWVAHTAALIYGAATFAWPLALTGLSHTLNVTLLLAAFHFVISARRDRREALTCSAIAGMLTGINLGCRLDTVFALPGLLVPLAFVRPPRLGALAAFAAGMAPVLALLAAINAEKFGVWNPLTYGQSSEAIARPLFHLTPGLLIAGGFAFSWLACQFPGWWKLNRQPSLALGLVVLGLVLADGGLRWNLKLIFWEGGPERHTDLPGNLTCRALLQACPYLALLPLAMFYALRDAGARRAAAWLLPLPLAYLTMIGLTGHFGKVHLYPRYLSPALPGLSILTAYALRRLRWLNRPRRAVWIAASVALCAAAMAVILNGYAGNVRAQNDVLMRLMGYFVLCLLAGMVLMLLCPVPRWGVMLRKVLAGLALTAIVFSALRIAAFDYPQISSMRGRTFVENEQAARLLPAHAAVLVSGRFLMTLAPFLDVPDVRVAMQPRDMGHVGFDEILRVLHVFEAQGRPLYIYITQEERKAIPWERLGYRLAPTGDGTTKLYALEPLFPASHAPGAETH